MANKPADPEICSREADAAKAAILRVVRETRDSLGTAVDVRLWTKKKPWLAMGLAATCGLAAAVLFRRAGTPAPTNGETPPSQPGPNSAKGPEPAYGGIGSAIASSLFDLAKFGLETAIMAKVRETSVRTPSSNDSGNETATSAAQE
jgi:hypothetical protein